MATKLEVSKADLVFEAGFPRPEFALFFRDSAGLLDHLYHRLEPYGLKLSDIRFERGNLGEQHYLIYLFNYWMTVRIRAERIEVTCADLPPDDFEKFKGAILDVLRGVKDHKPDLAFRTFGIALGLHAKIEGYTVQRYLARFVENPPKGLGPSTGSGVVFYFGAAEDRLLSTVTADMSAVVPGGLYIRIHGVWEAGRVAAEALAGIAEAFVREALESIDLQLSG